MIRCRRRHLEARCRQRGYTLDEVAACIFAEDGDTITVDETHASYPAAPKLIDPVTLLQKAKNFASSAARHVAAGMPMADDAEIARRYAICEYCPWLKNDACVKCGCPVYRQKKFLSKLAWAGESCPVGKWGPQAGQ